MGARRRILSFRNKIKSGYAERVRTHQSLSAFKQLMERRLCGKTPVKSLAFASSLASISVSSTECHPALLVVCSVNGEIDEVDPVVIVCV
ncbi:hypothetical protein BLNAU_2261 [Blattamonas nauphoetae]|uniref:Uncharacterized protein n=1 Tax=Blattamonas nauphoetae TaxID=2049346 RepID=A0ABQ9YGP8_9EUKA|nr:hypothetical protein BLNAU_2261 [Blattamonas nauphoetae]